MCADRPLSVVLVSEYGANQGDGLFFFFFGKQTMETCVRLFSKESIFLEQKEEFYVSEKTY